MTAANSIKNRLAAAPKAALPSFVLTTLDGETVYVRILSVLQIQQWYVWEHNDGKGQQWKNKTSKMWLTCACESDGTAISENGEDVQKLEDKFGGAFLVEFYRAAKRVNGLHANNSEEDDERQRFFTQRGLDVAKLNGSLSLTSTPQTTAKTSSDELPSVAVAASKPSASS